jgi:predicted permease
MNNNKNSDEISKRLNQQIRQANHSRGYYLSLFLLYFAIPLYVLSKFLYADAGGWELSDVLFVIILLAIAIYGIFRDHFSETKE